MLTLFLLFVIFAFIMHFIADQPIDATASQNIAKMLDEVIVPAASAICSLAVQGLAYARKQVLPSLQKLLAEKPVADAQARFLAYLAEKQSK